MTPLEVNDFKMRKVIEKQWKHRREMLLKYGNAVCPFPAYPERTEPATLYTPNAHVFGELKGAYTVEGTSTNSI